MDNNPVYNYVRVYFNKYDDPDKVWSVDSGPGTTEYNTKLVINSSKITSYTMLDLGANNSLLPKAWLKIPAARLRFGNGFIEVY